MSSKALALPMGPASKQSVSKAKFLVVTAGLLFLAAQPSAFSTELRIGVTNASIQRIFVVSETNRYYTLQRNDHLSMGNWSNVSGWEFVPGTGGLVLLGGGSTTESPESGGAFFRVMESTTNPWLASMIPYARLESVLAGAVSMYRSRTNDTVEAVNQAIAQYLASQPEFAAAGATLGGAWGRLTNGITVVFDNDSVAAARAAAHVRPKLDQPQIAHTVTHEIPRGDLACLYDNLPWHDFQEDVQTLLQNNGYRVDRRRNISVEDLMTLPRCGMFVLGTHGSDFFPATTYCLYTSTPQTPGNLVRYAGELLSGKLALYHLMWGEDLTYHLAVTAKGAEAWWNFTKDSLVLVDSCRSFNEVSADFRQAVLNKGASVYAGWTLRSLANKGPPTVLYLVDRLLGANQFEVESPLQRPFDWQLLRKPMRDKGLGFAWDPKYEGESVLAFQQSGDPSFGLLAPSIHRVTPRLDNKLQIIGFFGQDPGADGEVDVEGTRRTIQSWGPLGAGGGLEQILCDLPATGPGSVGQVRVTVRRHESNLVPISEYRPTFVYTYAQGGLKITLTFKPRIRADLHMSRTEPGIAPPPIEVLMLGDSESTCEYVCSGSQSDADTIEEWSGKGTLKVGGGTDVMATAAILDQKRGTMKIVLTAQAIAGLTRKVTDRSSGQSTTSTATIQVGQDTWNGTDPRIGKFVQASLNYNQSSDQHLNLVATNWISAVAARQYSGYWPKGTARIELTAACAPAHPPSQDEAR